MIFLLNRYGQIFALIKLRIGKLSHIVLTILLFTLNLAKQERFFLFHVVLRRLLVSPLMFVLEGLMLIRDP